MGLYDSHGNRGDFLEDVYRAVNRDGNLIDAMLSEHRDMAADQA